jgi:hypothetical protein
LAAFPGTASDATYKGSILQSAGERTNGYRVFGALDQQPDPEVEYKYVQTQRHSHSQEEHHQLPLDNQSVHSVPTIYGVHPVPEEADRAGNVKVAVPPPAPQNHLSQVFRVPQQRRPPDDGNGTA